MIAFFVAIFFSKWDEISYCLAFIEIICCLSDQNISCTRSSSAFLFIYLFFSDKKTKSQKSIRNVKQISLIEEYETQKLFKEENKNLLLYSI